MENYAKHFLSFWLATVDISPSQRDRIFAELSKMGVQDILAGGSAAGTAAAIEQAKKYNIALQHWQMVMINNNQEIISEHRDWFTVNRLGISSADEPAYVGYYRWLCPNHPEVLPYLRSIAESYCQLPGLAGFHLDYIRFSDVILPIKCQRQYKIQQRDEAAVYDQCYCAHCRERFAAEYGYDIREKEDPAADENWRQFRWDSITRIVKNLKETVHKYNKEITAAVFPTPSIARQLVRQDWSSWDLDRYYPMMYHEFYDKDTLWLQEAAKECRQSTSRPIHAGIYLPSYGSSSLEKAIETLKESQVAGICIFNYQLMNDKVKKTLLSQMQI